MSECCNLVELNPKFVVSPNTLISVTITKDGEYSPSIEEGDGYSKVTVKVTPQAILVIKADKWIKDLYKAEWTVSEPLLDEKWEYWLTVGDKLVYTGEFNSHEFEFPDGTYETQSFLFARSDKGRIAKPGYTTLVPNPYPSPEDPDYVIPLDRIPPAAKERLIEVADKQARLALTIDQVQNGDSVKQLDDESVYTVIDSNNLDKESGYAMTVAPTATDEDIDSLFD